MQLLALIYLSTTIRMTIHELIKFKYMSNQLQITSSCYHPMFQGPILLTVISNASSQDVQLHHLKVVGCN